jgi:hypothetical protein
MKGEMKNRKREINILKRKKEREEILRQIDKDGGVERG